VTNARLMVLPSLQRTTIIDSSAFFAAPGVPVAGVAVVVLSPTVVAPPGDDAAANRAALSFFSAFNSAIRYMMDALHG
jgi:hypothetical protein